VSINEAVRFDISDRREVPAFEIAEEVDGVPDVL
jgi:hypothetical protein